GQCGSCWAFGATEALADRCGISNGTFVELSPEYLVACDSTNSGCNGGNLDKAWAFLKKTGTVTDTCFPYATKTYDFGIAPSCPSTCSDGTAMTHYKASSYYNVRSTETAIENEIYSNGPVEAAFNVYEDFYSYESGVYVHKTGSYVGGHAIKILGWGTETLKPYWLVANSWGSDWGETGYFKILRGSNECGIEGNVVAGLCA
ncbi:cathepsin B, partial [Aduncisulcus paluster]